MKYKLKRPSTLLSTYTTLIVFELILSVVFFAVGHLIGSYYIRGVGVGLIIAWVTGALAYFAVRRKA
jgi:uncharacterized membrane protein YciS (DUF1049 family)